MRAAPLPLFVGVWMFRRTKRALVAVMLLVVTLAVLLVTVTTVVKFVPSVLTEMVNALVFQPVCSPPAPAWSMTNCVTLCTPPRSTCQNWLPTAPSEHHLSDSPPVMLPLTALSGVSVEAHEPSAVAGWFSARLFGTVPPPLYAGGASAAPLPHELAVEPSVKSSVTPFCHMFAAIQFFVVDTPLTFNDCTKKFDADACGAFTVIVAPLGRWMISCVNSGLLKIRSALPGVTGLKPSAPQTKLALMVPRSSLSGKPLGVSW